MALAHGGIAMSKHTQIDTSDNSILMQALHDPENQPSQFGTVPAEYLEKANDLIDRLVRTFDYRGCDCMCNSNECCAYAVACAYLGRPLCPTIKATGEA